MYYDPFRFLEIVRKGKAVMISFSLYEGSTEQITTGATIRYQIEQLRLQGIEDYQMAERLKALQAWERELQRDNWDEELNITNPEWVQLEKKYDEQI